MNYIEELYRTPRILSRVRRDFSAAALPKGAPLCFCGCGTTYYIAGAVAKLCSRAGVYACALEAVELMEPELPRLEPGTVMVFISRSGDSLEVTLAQRRLREAGFHCIYVGCAPGSTLDKECGEAFLMPYAGESFPLEAYSVFAHICTSVMLAGAGGCEGADEAVSLGFCEAERVYSIIKDKSFDRIISLGAPFYMPLLKEIMLKNGELTQLGCELWGTLEFRHGPRSWADERRLICLVPGESTEAYDRKAAQEIISYGCTLLWLGANAPKGSIGIDLRQERFSVQETLALAAFSFALAARLGAALGVDPLRLKNIVRNVNELT